MECGKEEKVRCVEGLLMLGLQSGRQNTHTSVQSQLNQASSTVQQMQGRNKPDKPNERDRQTGIDRKTQRHRLVTGRERKSSKEKFRQRERRDWLGAGRDIHTEETDRDRETQKDKDMQTERKTEKDRQTETERDRQADRDRQTEPETEREQIETDRARERERERVANNKVHLVDLFLRPTLKQK